MRSTLYDKVYRDDVLWVAYRRCLLNKGAAGVDDQTFEERHHISTLLNRSSFFKTCSWKRSYGYLA